MHVYVYNLTLTHFQQKVPQTMIQLCNADEVPIMKTHKLNDSLTIYQPTFFYLSDFDIKSNWLGIGNKTTVQTSTAIQCAYICYKTKECEEANFDNYKHLCDL
jgi:hypothetical protein